MISRILNKLFIALFPEALMLTGSLLLCFSLKLVNTQNLSEKRGIVNGGLEIAGMTANIPVQDDNLFWWGFILFIIGSALEFIKISYHTIQEEMKIIKTSSVHTEDGKTMDQIEKSSHELQESVNESKIDS